MKRFQPMGKRGERREVDVRIRIEHRDLMPAGRVFPVQMGSIAAVVVLVGIDFNGHTHAKPFWRDGISRYGSREIEDFTIQDFTIS